MQSFSRKTTREARDSRLTIVTYLIMSLALLALASCVVGAKRLYVKWDRFIQTYR